MTRRPPVVELQWTTEEGMNQGRAYDVARAVGRIASDMMFNTDKYEAAHSSIEHNGDLVRFSVYMKRVKE